MIQLHATRKLFDRLPLDQDGRLAETPRTAWLFKQASPDRNPLSDWHGHLVRFQRRQCVLMVHDATRFPLVLPAMVGREFAELNDRFADALMNTLLKCGADERILDAAQRLLGPLQVDTRCNRSVQGTLNRMKLELEHILWFDQVDIAELTGYRLGAWLADRPCGVKGQGWLWPQREMIALLSTGNTSAFP